MLGTQFLLLFLILGSAASAQNGAWVDADGDGQWGSSANWNNGIIATGANNTADFFSMVDVDATVVNANFPGFFRNAIQLEAARTIGHVVIGDMDTNTPGGWEIYVTANPGPLLTLAGTTPSITVHPLGPIDTGTEIIDDAIIRASLAGTAGLTKLGDGILTLDGLANSIAGALNVNAGTLRFGPNMTFNNPDPLNSGDVQTINSINLANGTTLEMFRNGNRGVQTVNVPAGATATIRGGSTVDLGAFVNNVTGGGIGMGTTVNVDLAAVDSQFSAHGTWGGIGTLNVSGPTPPTPDQNARFRLRPNGGGFNGASFANTVVNVDSATIVLRSNSGSSVNHNNIEFGELHGTATAGLTGGVSGGGPAHYIIGGLNTDADFAGNIGNGADATANGLDIIKNGTGTLTLSGTLTYSPVATGPQSGNADRRGGITRVNVGTLKLNGTTALPAGIDDTGTATNLGILRSTLNVRPGAFFDVSGATGTYSTSTLQQVLGGGTVIGNYNHDEGLIAPGDDNAVNSATRVPTAGTLTFANNLNFNGGEIVYDMTLNPLAGNDLIQVNGATTVGGGGKVTPNFLAGVPESGTYTIVNSSSPITGSTAGWTVAWPGRGTPPSVSISGNQLQFTAVPVTGGADLNWRGTASSVWNINGAQNFHNNGTDAADVYFNGDDVTFADTFGTGNTPVTNFAVSLGVDVAPTSLTVDSANDYMITGSGRITGPASFIKRGASTLVLQTPNTFSGPASIEAGTVNIGGAFGALGTGNLTMSGATLRVENTVSGGMTNSNLTLAAGTSNTVFMNGTPGMANTNPGAIPGLAGSGDLLVATEVDGRLFDFGGVSSAFTGDLTIAPDGVTAGTIAGRFPSTAGGGIPGGTLTLAAGATLSIRGNAVGTTEIGAVTGAVSSTLAGFAGGGVPADKTWQIGALNTPSVFDGIITDGGGTGGTALTNVIKVGTSSLSLSGANTYTGDTTVQTGMFRTTNDSVLPDATDLFVTTGAFVNLDFSGMDTINTLTLGGVVQAIGTYGATGSGADFIRNDFFSGMGRVNVMMVAVTPILIGDYNDNGIVDAADYTVWRDSLGTGFVLPNRDPANMGNVSADDYTSWVNNFGAVPGAGSLSVQNSVPEPTSLAMMIIVTVSLLGGRLCGRR